MKHALRFTVALLLGAALSGAALAGAGKVTRVPVTTIISDYDTGIATSLQLRSDSGGWYQQSATLDSFIFKGGNTDGSFQLDAYYVSQATRTIYLGFDYPVPGSGTSPVPSGFYKAIVTSECWRYGNSLWTLGPGATMQCPLAARFDYGGKSYHVHMNDRNWSETSPATVTCIFPTSGTQACAQWRITPSRVETNPDGSVTYRNVAALHEEVVSRGKTTLVNRGDFYFSFVLLITNP